MAATYMERTAKNATKDELRDALSIAHSMLKIVQSGGSLTIDAWYERMRKIETVMAKDGR